MTAFEMPLAVTPQFLSGQLSDPERRTLVDTARRLREATRQGRPGTPLKGRHFAIATEAADSDSTHLFEEAAEGLGARVSRIGPQALARNDNRASLARMLGSLYDAVDCSELGPERAAELQALAGVPVFNGIAEVAHPLRALLPAVDDDGGGACDAGNDPDDPDDHARLTALLQAVLLETVV